MNFIMHFKGWINRIEADDRLKIHHVSLYIALFQYWNANRFRNPFTIFRHEIMAISKIGSINTYTNGLRDLSEWNYIRYEPSFNPQVGSKVHLYRFDKGGDKADDKGTNKARDKGGGKGTDQGGDKGTGKGRDKGGSKAVGKGGDGGISKGGDKGTSKGGSKGTDQGGDKGTGKGSDKGTSKGGDKGRATYYTNIPNSKNNLNILNELNAYGTSNENSNFVDDRRPDTYAEAARSGGHHRSKKIQEQGARSAAVPGSLEEARAYFVEIQSTAIEAEKFFNHYQSNGWKVGGRAPMKDWRAAARNWKINSQKFANESSNQPKPGKPNTGAKNYAEPL